MAEQQRRPITHIGIHDRTPEMRILYASSSIRLALLYEPEEVIGRSGHEFMADANNAKPIQQHLGTYTDDNVVITSVFLKRKDGTPAFSRSIAFACGSVMFHLGISYPNLPADKPIDYLAMQRYRWVLNDDGNEQRDQHLLHSGSSQLQHKLGSSTIESSAHGSLAPTEGKSLCKSIADSIRKTHQACFVLEDLRASYSDGNHDAKILFVTDSINRIINVDSCDLKDRLFLSLVAVEDRNKAATFLGGALFGNVLVLERLRLLINPLEDIQLEGPQSSLVEFLAMGSDGGVIMLCQLAARWDAGYSNNSNSGYMSLEDIISSDPWTSDYA